MGIAYLAITILLAAMVTFSGIAKIRRDPRIVQVIHEVVGVPLKYFPLLAACEFAGALGVVLGIWWPLLGVAAGIGLVIYFVCLEPSDFEGVQVLLFRSFCYMDVHRELTELKARIDALQADIASKQETSAALSELRASVDSIEDKLALSDRFVKIEQEHESWKTLAKYITVTVSILGIVFGYLGYSSFDKFLREQVNQRLSYSATLAYGLSWIEKNPRVAVPYLRRCFEERPVDEPLVNSLLYTLDKADDWENTRAVMGKLRKEHLYKLLTFSDALTYNSIGVAELNLGFADKEHFEFAREAFETGLKKPSTDKDVPWYLYTNLWRYYLAIDDAQNAKQQVELAKHELAKQSHIPPDAECWTKAKDWAWFKEYFAVRPKHKIDEQQIKQMYEEFSGPNCYSADLGSAKR
jgi:hypothetical protein